MGQVAMGITHQKVSEPEPRGERVAKFVEEHMEIHKGLCLGELAFRLRVDKRDLQRLLRDRSCGWRLEDSLAAYFGDIFVEAIFRPIIGQGVSQREQELQRELIEITARHERLKRERADRRAERQAAGGDHPG
jgi:hypothetical protein